MVPQFLVFDSLKLTLIVKKLVNRIKLSTVHDIKPLSLKTFSLIFPLIFYCLLLVQNSRDLLQSLRHVITQARSEYKMHKILILDNFLTGRSFLFLI